MLDPNRFYRVKDNSLFLSWRGTVVIVRGGKKDGSRLPLIIVWSATHYQFGTPVYFQEQELESCDYDYPDEPMPEEIINYAQ